MSTEDEQSPEQKALVEQFHRSRAKKEAPKTWLQQVPIRGIVLAMLAVVVLAVVGVFAVTVMPGVIDRARLADTAKHFCLAIAEDDYSTAYSKLSTGVRGHLSQAGLADTFKQAHIAACDTNQQLSDFTVSNGHASVAISFARTDDSGTVTPGKYGGEMIFVQQDDDWKVDGFVASQGDILA